jgi:RNA polymerase sigma-70 factor (ECF subfamily)
VGAPSAEDVSCGDDAELMLRTKDGDDAAFEVLVEKFHRPLVGFLFRMVNERGVAEELAQETFLRMYRSRSSYAVNAKSAIWMYRIAAGLAIQHEHNGRWKRTNASPSGDHREENSATQAYVPTVSAGQGGQRHELLTALRLQIEALPDDQRIAVLLHKYQGLDYPEIAAVLAISESETKSLLLRAYGSLREKLRNFM